MKKLFFLPLIAMMTSCGGNSSDSESTSTMELSYEIDTVMVDAGDHFFFLNWSLSISDLSEDGKFLYNFNPNNLTLEIVDLENLKLDNAIELEREGPNGVGGGFISKIQVLSNGNLMLFDFNEISEISPSGELLGKIELEQLELTGYDITEDEKVSNMGVFSSDGKTYYGILEDEDFSKPAKGLVKINLKNQTADFVKMDMFERLDEFKITMRQDQMTMSTGETVYMDVIGGELVVGNSAFNEFFIWETESDSLIQKTYNATLTSNEKIGNWPQEVESQEELFAASKEKNEQVSFGKLIQHPNENLLWRIAGDKDRMIADSVVKKQVVTLFDSEYNMLFEEKLEEYPSSSQRFFKDGMLYTFLNIDDEMAFVRLKPKGANGNDEGKLVRAK